MVDGEVVEDPEDDVEPPEDDVETGNKTCCGCLNSTVPDTEGDEMVNIVPQEERLNLEGGEVTEAPGDDLETIRQSENEAENVVSDLIDTVITDIIM